MIKVTCPECHKTIEVPLSQAGTVETCIHCGNEMMIPRRKPTVMESTGKFFGSIREDKNKCIILILVGVGIPIISFFFFTTEKDYRGQNIKSILQREFVFYDGDRAAIYVDRGGKVVEKGNDSFGVYPNSYPNRISISLKYPFSLSVILILTGTGFILTSKKKTTEADSKEPDNSKEQQ